MFGEHPEEEPGRERGERAAVREWFGINLERDPEAAPDQKPSRDEGSTPIRAHCSTIWFQSLSEMARRGT